MKNFLLFALAKQWPLLVCTLLLSACAPTVTNTLYTLQPVRQQPLGQEFADFKEIILLMPVQLAPQLQGRGLIRQDAAGTITAAANHLWAGPLDQQISQQIASDLKDLLATDNIAIYPGPRFGTVGYQLEVEISDFSSNGHSFKAIIVFTLSDTAARTILQRKTFRQMCPLDSPDYSGYIANASQAIADLSKEIALALLASRRSQSVPGLSPR